jgi:hypothetical protein
MYPTLHEMQRLLLLPGQDAGDPTRAVVDEVPLEEEEESTAITTD